MTAGKAYWNRLSRREQRLLSIGALALALALIYSLIWQPWQQRHEEWQRTLTREQQTVSWMLQQAPYVVRDPAPKPTLVNAHSVSLLVLISQSSSHYGLQASRLQPQGDQVSVTLTRSDFTALMQWLGELEQQGVSVIQLDVSAVAAEPGSVDISRLVLERRNEK